MASKPILNYATGDATKKRIRMIVFVGIALPLAVVGVIYSARLARWAWVRHGLIALDREMASYTSSPDTVLFEDSAWPQDFYNTTDKWKQVNPHFYRDTFSYSGPPGGYFVLFSHQRTAPTGEQRTVMVVIGISDFHETDAVRRVFFVGKGVFTSTSWSEKGSGMLSFRDPPPEHYLPRGIRFYAGQPDALDQSRFTIRFEIYGHPGVVEGRLDPGAATVSMSPWPEG